MGRGRHALLLLLSLSSFAAAQECQRVTSIPADLGAGNHCLAFDFGVGGTTAIRLRDGARLDCRGHRIRALSTGYDRAIYGVGNDIAVRNCRVSDFGAGIIISGDRALIERNRVERAGVAIQITGSNGLVARNVVTDYRPGYSAYGISVDGSVDVLGNAIVARNTPEQGRYGIRMSGLTKGVVARNTVIDVGGPTGIQSIAISTLDGGPAIIRDNVATASPGSGDIPIFCYMVDGTVSVDNLWVGFPHRVGSCD